MEKRIFSKKCKTHYPEYETTLFYSPLLTSVMGYFVIDSKYHEVRKHMEGD